MDAHLERVNRIRNEFKESDLVEMRAWAAAFNAACRACDMFPADGAGQAHRFGAARAIKVELDKRGIEVPWPKWMHYGNASAATNDPGRTP